MILRPATAADADQLLALVLEFHRRAKPPYSAQRTLDDMLQPGQMIWVAEQDGKLVAYVWISSRGSREAFVEQILGNQVTTDAFVDLLIPMLRDAGFAVITTVAITAAWKKMVERWGFKVTGVVLERVIEPSGMARVPLLPDEAGRTLEAGTSQEAK